MSLASWTGADWDYGRPSYTELPVKSSSSRTKPGTHEVDFDENTLLSGLTLTQDLSAFVMTAYDEDSGEGGQILEFRFKENRPFEWVYAGRVF